MYSILCIGIWLLASPIIVESSIRKQRRLKYQSEVKEKVKKPFQEEAIYIHLEKILTIVSKEITRQTVYNFIAITIILFICSFAMFYIWSGNFIYAILIALFLACIPYIVVRLRVINIRLHTSMSLLNNYDIILSNFQATKDIYYTFLHSLDLIKDKHLKQVISKLLMSMAIDRNQDEFKKAEKLFVYSINSQYAKRFGKLLLKAYLEKAEIETALVQLGKDIQLRKQSIQREKSETTDTFIMGLSQPFILAFSFYISYRMSGIGNYWYYFKQENNLFLFIIALLFSLVSVLIAIIIRQPKSDI